MAELTKKLIGFDQELLEKIEKYSKKEDVTFTEAVRKLIEFGLNPVEVKTEDEPIIDKTTVDIIKKYIEKAQNSEERLDKLEKDMSWWNADDNESKVGNLQVQVNEMEKKLNMVVAIAKKLKGHLENRDIHLQD